MAAERVGDQALHPVFTYGTLKCGQPNHHILMNPNNGRATLIGTARTLKKWPLVLVSSYEIPCLLPREGMGHVSANITNISWAQEHFRQSCCWTRYQRRQPAAGSDRLRTKSYVNLAHVVELRNCFVHKCFPHLPIALANNMSTVRICWNILLHNNYTREEMPANPNAVHIISECSQTTRFIQEVSGEMYLVDDRMLESLDGLESYPDVYVRTQQDVALQPSPLNSSIPDAEAKLRSGGLSSTEGSQRRKAWIYFVRKVEQEHLSLPFVSCYTCRQDIEYPTSTADKQESLRFFNNHFKPNAADQSHYRAKA
ncbi:uncharacterized protein LOC142578299 [Dermacentor variabilis]|uniref:uncharacterized protein LOC142578299 n=1 Tax=Dermacentor variabilis TaxID=34621 RepID=UPI003F5B0D45